MELLDVADVRWRVERQLIEFLSAKTASYPPEDEVSSLLTPIVSLLLASGKRLRGALCYWGWIGAGGPDGDDMIAAASALELLQGFALIHDDVMDASDLRRGQPSVHRHFTSNHTSHHWRGSPERFGDAGAILAGDLCLVWADEMLHDSGMSAEHLFAAAPIYNTMRERTVRGQYLDILTQAYHTSRPADPWRVALDKTAANTTCGPLAFGAALAGATDDIRAAYEAYAVPLGVAFQLRDDLLGAFGRPEITGKPSGDDLRDGKRTLLLARARELGDPDAVTRIGELLHADSDDRVPELRVLLESTGARGSIEDLIIELGHRAIGALDTAQIHPQAKRVLQGLAASLTTATEG